METDAGYDDISSEHGHTVSEHGHTVSEHGHTVSEHGHTVIEAVVATALLLTVLTPVVGALAKFSTQRVERDVAVALAMGQQAMESVLGTSICEAEAGFRKLSTMEPVMRGKSRWVVERSLRERSLPEQKRNGQVYSTVAVTVRVWRDRDSGIQDEGRRSADHRGGTVRPQRDALVELSAMHPETCM